MTGNCDNMGYIILDLCGGSGSWSRPFAMAGYDVRLITLPTHDVLNYSPPDNVFWGIGGASVHRVFCFKLPCRGKGEVPRRWAENS